MPLDVDRRLQRWALQAAARELMPDELVAKCLRWVIPGQGVQVLYSEIVKRAHYKNLMVCASVWMCSICSAKISERRRVELTQFLEKSDLRIVLATFTLQHDKDDDLKAVLDVLNESYRFLKSGRIWKNFEQEFGLIGSISALEVTYGENGWHPHRHALFFFEKSVDLGALERFFKSRWIEILDRSGSSASWRRGVDVQNGDGGVAEYIAKYGHEPVYTSRTWGVEHELTKAPVKIARGTKGSTPLDLLAQYAFATKKKMRRRAGALWTEYARVFKGRRQLVWSRGLREKLGLQKEESDEEVAMREDETAILLSAISLKNWRIVLGNDARGELLEIASSGDRKRLNEFLNSLGCEV